MSLILSQPVIYRMARRAGQSKKASRIFSAIAMCEAPGPVIADMPHADFGLIGDVSLADVDDGSPGWGPSYGGLQIRSRYEQHNTGLLRDATRLLEPDFNMKSGIYIKEHEGGFRAWSTFSQPPYPYRAYLPKDFPPAPGTYYVWSGDTLSDIAVKFGNMFTWQELARLNNMHEPYSLSIGQVLLLP